MYKAIVVRYVAGKPEYKENIDLQTRLSVWVNVMADCGYSLARRVRVA
jgi:hypothetical protein